MCGACLPILESCQLVRRVQALCRQVRWRVSTPTASPVTKDHALLESAVLLPLAYAGGVALPVLAFGVLIAFSATKVGVVFDRVGRVERWARYATGGVFLSTGVYFTLAYTLGVLKASLEERD